MKGNSFNLWSHYSHSQGTFCYYTLITQYNNITYFCGKNKRKVMISKSLINNHEQNSESRFQFLDKKACNILIDKTLILNAVKTTK